MERLSRVLKEILGAVKSIACFGILGFRLMQHQWLLLALKLFEVYVLSGWVDVPPSLAEPMY